MSTIFTKIINREIPAHVIYEDDICIAILDRFPVVPGQTLIIPKTPVDYYFNLDDETLVHLLAVSKKIAKVLDVAYKTLRTCVAIEGFEVPHAHIKLYPLTTDKFQIHGGTEWNDTDLGREATKIKSAITPDH